MVAAGEATIDNGDAKAVAQVMGLPSLRLGKGSSMLRIPGCTCFPDQTIIPSVMIVFSMVREQMCLRGLNEEAPWNQNPAACHLLQS